MSSVVLSVHNLTKNYFFENKTIKSLDNVSFDLHAGEVFALLGTNGAGKTTLSSLLATVITPTCGEVIYKNRSIYEQLTLYRRQVGYCPQRPNLNPYLTLRDNLYFAGCFYGLSTSKSNQAVHEVSEQFELSEYLNVNPGMLSGGWRQRFMLARSIVHRPSILILDEPTIALDPHVRRKLWDKIKSLKEQGISIILTTHYLDEAEVLADRVCILDRGLIKLIDKPSNLKNDFKLKTLEEVFLKLTEEEVKC